MATSAQARSAIAVAQQKQAALKSRLPVLKGAAETSARKVYGDGTAKLNTATSAANKDPNKAYTNATGAQAAFDAGLKVTNAPTAQPTGAAGTTYVVARGDTLSKIGAKVGVDWRAIYEANKKVIGPDPGKIEVGMRLVLPKAPAPARPSPAIVRAPPPAVAPPSVVPPGVEAELPQAPAWFKPAVKIVGVAAAAGAAYWIYKTIFGGKKSAAQAA